MSLEAIIYWANVVNTFIWIFSIFEIILIFIIIGLLAALEGAEDGGLNIHEAGRILKILILIFIINGILLIFIPSKNTIYMMMGVSSAKQAIATPEAQKVIRLINLEFDDKIKKLEGK